jgi:uncharacterized membrane protein YgdD (TMEM256/DUF423 family)
VARAPVKRTSPGPDPAVGASIALLGIFAMGVTGAATQHYLFNLSTGVAILGAVLFVGAVTITALRQRRDQKRGTDSSAT